MRLCCGPTQPFWRMTYGCTKLATEPATAPITETATSKAPCTPSSAGMLKPMVPLTIPATSGPDINASARNARVITASRIFITPSIMA
ncbi:hypothetical protein D3C76_1464430 [compost metagenome]